MKLIVYSFCLFVSSWACASTQAQSLILTTKTFAATVGGPAGSFEPQEILVADSHLSGARHLVPQTALNTLMGDGNGDFSLNDFNRNIDALSPILNPGVENTLSLLLSVDQTMNVIGNQVKDGDVFTIDTKGRVRIVYPEAHFASTTQTSTVDVDAFHEAQDGTLYFSFANDETTTSPALIAANGGNPVLDESTVFQLGFGQLAASLLFTRSDILQFVNNAMSSSYSSIVDLTGLTPDPNFPQEWIFAIGSTNSAIEGRLFSTASGGSIATLFGLALDSNYFGFIDEEVIEGLAYRPVDSAIFCLYGPNTVPSPAGIHSYAISGGTPHQVVQLFASNSLFPAPSTFQYSGFNGFPFIYVNPSDMLFSESVSNLDFSRYVDVAGEAVISFATAHLPIGLRITMQAVDTATGSISMPASAGI
ncbi:MAG: hypothetical protein ACI97A_003516 [Planctomycetota bacterium]|jgi:hypothetical protein